MVIVRVVVLMFLVAYGWGMGQIPPDGLNGFGKFVAFSFFLTAPALYFLPSYEASRNNHPNLTSIALVNIFLGWSLIGWVIAIVWAFKKPEAALAVSAAPVATTEPQVKSATKKCPYCAEEILAEAIKCKHCGSDLSVPAPTAG